MERSAEWCLATLTALAEEDGTSGTDSNDLFQVSSFVRAHAVEFNQHFAALVERRDTLAKRDDGVKF